MPDLKACSGADRTRSISLKGTEMQWSCLFQPSYCFSQGTSNYWWCPNFGKRKGHFTKPHLPLWIPQTYFCSFLVKHSRVHWKLKDLSFFRVWDKTFRESEDNIWGTGGIWRHDAFPCRSKTSYAARRQDGHCHLCTREDSSSLCWTQGAAGASASCNCVFTIVISTCAKTCSYFHTGRSSH